MLDVRVTAEEGYLGVVARGILQVKDLSTHLETLLEAAAHEGRQALLIDARQVQAPATSFLRQLVGIKFAERLPAGMRVVILFPANQITSLTEEAAREWGGNLRVMGDESAALEWLLNRSQPVA
jgi:hypothetical protein